MTPAEIRLFTANEQSLLVDAEPDRLRAATEDDLAELLVRVRRMRDKYSGLHRRQGRASVEAGGKRYAATTSNERTLRKAELLEDTLSRVSLALSRAARASANDLKRERIETARTGKAARRQTTANTDEQGRAGSGRAQGRAGSGRAGSGRAQGRAGSGKVQSKGRAKSGPKGSAKRVAATRATTARQQARRDRRR